jgi:hypothetical protein
MQPIRASTTISMSSTPSALTIMHLNVQSITNKKHELGHFLAKHNIDVCSLNETWLTPNKNFKIQGYQVFRLDRQNSPHGGVAILIKNDIPAIPVTIQSSQSELLAVSLPNVMPNGSNLGLATYYNPPGQPLDKQAISNFFATHPQAILVGDLNAHNRSWGSQLNNPAGDALEQILESDHLLMINNEEPTYEPIHRPTYKAILDLAITNQATAANVLHFSTTDELRSDHTTIIIKVRSCLPRKRQQVTTIKTLNMDKLKSVLLSCCPEINQINNKEDLDKAANSITRTIQAAQDSATKIKQINIEPSRFLVLPDNIIKLIKQKRAARRRAQTDETAKTKYYSLAKQVRTEINNFKSTKWQDYCTELNSLSVSDTKLWNAIKSIDSSGKGNYKLPCLVNGTGPLTNKPNETAEIFASTLEQVFSNQDDPSFDSKNQETVSQGIATRFSSPLNNVPMEPTTAEEIRLILATQIRPKGAPGQDRITNRVLKALPAEFHSSLATIFNASLKLSHVPTPWKQAEVILIPKPDKDHTQPSNHRPISLLNTLSKLLERVVLVRINKWIKSNNLLSNNQAGFRQHRQTKDHILRLIQDGVSALNKDQYLGALFVDIKQAFDSVWHEGMLYKLEKLNMPNYLGKWISSYLYQRSFQVRVEQSKSSPKRIERGVPQGSVLGPVLFILYFNDIDSSHFTAADPTRSMFADDLASWYASRSLKMIQLRLQSILDHVEQWMSNWRMQLSVQKTVFCIFNNGGKFNQLTDKVKLCYKGEPIKAEKHFKFLGVTLDPKLTLNEHAKTIKARATKRLNMLKSIKGRKWGATTKLLLITYKVLVRSLIEYAPFALIKMSPTYQETIERIQRAAVRIATYWPPGVSTSVMYSQLKLESLKERAFKLTDKYLCKGFKLNSLITNLIKDYNQAEPTIEGLFKHPKSKPIKSILGVIKTDQSLNCHKLFDRSQQLK